MSSLTVNSHFYTRYTAQERADIGRYAHQNGVTAAARHFSRLGQHLRESSIRSIRTAYREELGRKRKADGENIIRAGISGFLDNHADQCETCNSSEDEGSSSDDNNSCGDDEMW